MKGLRESEQVYIVVEGLEQVGKSGAEVAHLGRDESARVAVDRRASDHCVYVGECGAQLVLGIRATQRRVVVAYRIDLADLSLFYEQNPLTGTTVTKSL